MIGDLLATEGGSWPLKTKKVSGGWWLGDKQWGLEVQFVRF